MACDELAAAGSLNPARFLGFVPPVSLRRSSLTFPGGAAYGPAVFVPKGNFMTNAEFERELASATGETLGVIRSRGFQLVEPPTLEPLTVDWDELDSQRVALFAQRGSQKRCQAA